MKGFAGFPAGKQALTPLPNLFFMELLPAIDHLAELKVTLYVFWLLAQKTGEHRYVSDRELTTDRRLLDGLASGPMSPTEVLRDALERAVARQTLLRVFSEEGAQQRGWYFVNSERGRRSVEDLLEGKWVLDGQAEPAAIQTQRPNIFVLYEQNIGPLTPMLADELMEAEDTYPASWIKDAFREAVELNKRSWRYIERILERWAQEGRGDEESRRADDRGRRRFIEGEYADYIEH